MCDQGSTTSTSSSDCKEEAAKLYQKNFEQFNKQKDFIRTLLFCLLRHDNDVKRINTELSNLLDRLKCETDKLKADIRKLRGDYASSEECASTSSSCVPSLSVCEKCIEEFNEVDEAEEDCEVCVENDECNEVNECFEGDVCSTEIQDYVSCDPDKFKNQQIAEKCSQITALCECFGKVAKKLKLSREEIVKLVQHDAKQFFEIKTKFLKWQEEVVENVKRCSVCNPNQNKYADSAKHIRELQDLFCNELKYIKCCEEQLKKLFFLVKGDDLCFTARSDSTSSSGENVSAIDMYWPPIDHFANAFEENLECFKQRMGDALIKAYAHMHLLQPEDPTAFLEQYLRHLQAIEDRERERKCRK